MSGTLRFSAAESGISQALRGTLWIGVFVVLLAFPLGIAAALYLEEYAADNRLTRFIDINIRNLAGVPSIGRNGVLVLMSIELILNAVNINLVALGALHGASGAVTGQVFALFVITIAAAEVGVGLAIVLLIYRNRASVDLDEVDLMKG
ncbi:MAG: NADH-quinone oxidoreductase subunit NuoK [Actinobacteria bacterium]|nr:NADH-quinone oxidoreductase subunit NuoK [Actinomycetota bacterium]